jgi:hypothetical protein
VICLRDLERRTVAATPDDHTGEAPRAQKLVDRISRNTTQEFSGFLDRVQRPILHSVRSRVLPISTASAARTAISRTNSVREWQRKSAARIDDRDVLFRQAH